MRYGIFMTQEFLLWKVGVSTTDSIIIDTLLSMVVYKTGMINTSYSKLAKQSKLSLRTVQRSVNRLRKVGLLSISGKCHIKLLTYKNRELYAPKALSKVKSNVNIDDIIGKEFHLE